MKNCKRSILTAVIGLLMIISVCVGMSSCVSGESADKLFEKSLTRTFENMESYDIVKTVFNIAKSGSIEANIYSNDKPDETNGRIKLYFNGKDGKAAIDFDGKIDGYEVDAEIYASDEKIILGSDEFLGNIYGFSLNNYGKQLKSSIFNPDSESKYALSDSQYDILLDILEKIDENQTILKDGKRFLKKYTDKFYDELEENTDISKENVKTDVLEFDDVNATVLTFSITDTELLACVSSVFEEAKEDKKLEEWLNKNLIESECAQLYTGRFTSVDELYENVDNYLTECKNNCGKLSVELTIYLNPGSGSIMKVDAVTNTDETKDKYTVELGYKFKTFEGFRISHRSFTDGNWGKSETVYLKVISDTKEELKIQFVSGNNVEIPEITLKYNRKDGNATFSYSGKHDVIVKFSVDAHKGEYKFELTSVSINGVKEKLPYNVSLAVKEKDSMPKIPKYTDIVNITDEELDKTVSKFNSSVSTVTKNIKKLFVSDIFKAALFPFGD